MKPKYRLSTVIFAGVLASAGQASAQSQWTNTTAGTQQWNTLTNWDTNPTVPNAIGAVANLSVNLAAVQTVNIASGVTLGSLIYGDSTTGFFAQNIIGSTITFNNSGSGATLTQVGASAILPGAISNNIVLDDNLAIVNNGTNADRSAAMNLSGVISGTGGITINSGGNGAVFLSNGGNTYSGGFTLNAANAKVVTYYNGDAFGTGTITINAGTVDTSAPGGAALLLTTSNANVWNGNFTTGIWNNNGNITLGNNITLSRGSNFGVGGSISETGGARSLTLNGNSSSIFNGTNTYTGGTTVSAGSLALLKTASMPSTGNVSFANNTTLGIGLGGDGWTSTGTGAGTLDGIFQGTNVGVGNGGVALNYTTAVGLNLFVTGSHSFGAISNLGSGATAFTKSGIGTLTITGDNTYTGATTVQGGGGLILDYGASNISKFASAATLTLGGVPNTSTGVLGGGRITLKGGSFTEIVSATSLNAGQTTIARDGGSAKLRLNAITRAAGGTISFADATIADTDRTNTNGIIGGYATLGNDWAINSTNGADGAITALAAYDGALPNSAGSATANYTLSGNLSLAGVTAANTIKITDTGANESLTLGANNLTITSASATALGGIMYAGGTSGSYTINGGGAGRLGTSSNNQELVFAVQSGTLNVNAIFAGSNTITKTGAGTMVIGATNTGNGFYYINEGVMRLNNAAATGAAGNFGGLSTFVLNGAALELTGGFSFTNQERVMISGSGISNGGALRSISGANTWRGVVEIGHGGARINNDSANLFTINNGITTIAGGDVTFGGAGDTTVTDRTNDFRFGTHAINGGGGLIKDGSGTLTLSGRNNYVGATTVSNGTFEIAASGSTHSTSAVTVNNFANLVVNGTINGTLLANVSTTVSGTGTIAGAANILGTHNPGNSPGIQTYGSDLSYSGGASIVNWDLGDNTTTNAPNPNANYDQILVGGNLAFTGTTTLNLLFAGVGSTVLWADTLWDTDQSWTLYDVTGTTTNFANFELTTIDWLDSGSNSFDTSRIGNSFSLSQSGQDVILNYTVIPEPSSALLGAIGLLALLRRRR